MEAEPQKVDFLHLLPGELTSAVLMSLRLMVGCVIGDTASIREFYRRIGPVAPHWHRLVVAAIRCWEAQGLTYINALNSFTTDANGDPVLFQQNGHITALPGGGATLADAEAGTIHTVDTSGTGRCVGSFTIPCCALVAGEDLYVAESMGWMTDGGQRVLRVSLTDAALLPLASVSFEGSPNALALWGDQLFVCDSQVSKIFACDKETLNVLRCFGEKGSELGQLRGPMGICICETGDGPLIAVADTANNRVSIFDMQGSFVRTLGKRGSADFHPPPGEFSAPHAIASSHGLLVVAESYIQTLNGNVRSLGRIQVLSESGVPLQVCKPLWHDSGFNPSLQAWHLATAANGVGGYPGHDGRGFGMTLSSTYGICVDEDRVWLSTWTQAVLFKWKPARIPLQMQATEAIANARYRRELALGQTEFRVEVRPSQAAGEHHSDNSIVNGTCGEIFHSKMSTRMGNIMGEYCRTHCISTSAVSFYFENELVSEQDTPLQLGMGERVRIRVLTDSEIEPYLMAIENRNNNGCVIA